MVLKLIIKNSRDSTSTTTNLPPPSPNQIGTHSRIKNKGSINKKTNKKKKDNHHEHDTRLVRNTNFAKNIDVPGKPTVVNTTIKEQYHNTGELYHKPVICQKSLVP